MGDLLREELHQGVGSLGGRGAVHAQVRPRDEGRDRHDPLPRRRDARPGGVPAVSGRRRALHLRRRPHRARHRDVRGDRSLGDLRTARARARTDVASIQFGSVPGRQRRLHRPLPRNRPGAEPTAHGDRDRRHEPPRGRFRDVRPQRRGELRPRAGRPDGLRTSLPDRQLRVLEVRRRGEPRGGARAVRGASAHGHHAERRRHAPVHLRRRQHHRRVRLADVRVPADGRAGRGHDGRGGGAAVRLACR